MLHCRHNVLKTPECFSHFLTYTCNRLVLWVCHLLLWLWLKRMGKRTAKKKRPKKGKRVVCWGCWGVTSSLTVDVVKPVTLAKLEKFLPFSYLSLCAVYLFSYIFSTYTWESFVKFSFFLSFFFPDSGMRSNKAVTVSLNVATRSFFFFYL